jgi:SAM-dependent methyltransferase
MDEWSVCFVHFCSFCPKAMLDHNNREAFTDPVDYDYEDSSDDGVAFYAALARETGGPVLEVACGTGRVAIPIAKLGYTVTGLDIEPGMLARAREKSAGLPARWVEGDARSFDLGEKFRLIFMTGNAFQAFVTNEEQATVLQRAYAHLHDEGLFAFETRNPLLPGTKTRAGLFLTLETINNEIEWPAYLNKHGYEVRVSTTQIYDPISQTLHLAGVKRWHDGAQEHMTTSRTALRYTFPQELNALLHCNGFDIVRTFGDWDESPLTAISPSIISVCRKR